MKYGERSKLVYNKSRLAENFHLVDEYSSLQRNQFFSQQQRQHSGELFRHLRGVCVSPSPQKLFSIKKNSSLAMRTFCVDRLELRTTETSFVPFLGLFHVVLFVSRGKKLMQLKFHLELQFVDFCTLYAGGVVHLFSLYIYILVLYIGGGIIF